MSAGQEGGIKTIFSYVSAAAAVVLFFFAYSFYQDLLKTEIGVMSNIDSAENSVSFSNSAVFVTSEANRKKYFDSKDYGSKQKRQKIKRQVVKKDRPKITIKPIKAYRNIQFANNYDKSIVATPKKYRTKYSQPQKYNTVSSAITQKFSEKVIKPENTSSSISLWDIAKAGIRAVNNLTGSKIELEKQTLKNGTGETLAGNSRNFNFSTKIKKNKF